MTATPTHTPWSTRPEAYVVRTGFLILYSSFVMTNSSFAKQRPPLACRFATLHQPKRHPGRANRSVGVTATISKTNAYKTHRPSATNRLGRTLRLLASITDRKESAPTP